LALDNAGNVYVVGATAARDFPVTKGAFQKINKAAADGQQTNAFMTKLDLSAETGDYFPAGISISLSPSAPVPGQKATLTVKVTRSAGTRVPTGVIRFPESTSALHLAPLTLDKTGEVSCETPALSAGSYTVYALYSGDDEHLTSQAQLSFQVTE
jgi:hypothetical protein